RARGLTKNPSSGTKGASLVAGGVGVRHSAALPEAAPNARLVRASDGASERAPPNRALWPSFATSTPKDAARRLARFLSDLQNAGGPRLRTHRPEQHAARAPPHRSSSIRG